MSFYGKVPLTGREKISSRVHWCFRLIQVYYYPLVPGGASAAWLVGYG